MFSAWNQLQTDLQLQKQIPIRALKNVVKGLEADSTDDCYYFLSCLNMFLCLHF